MIVLRLETELSQHLVNFHIPAAAANFLTLCVQLSAFDDPHEACLSVVAESYRLWLNHETCTNDITMNVTPPRCTCGCMCVGLRSHQLC